VGTNVVLVVDLCLFCYAQVRLGCILGCKDI